MKTHHLIPLLICLAVSSLEAQQLKPTLNYNTALKIEQGCTTYAEKNNLNMAIAIYDAYGQLMSFARMDDVSVGAANVAQWKGKSAALYRYSTAETGEWGVPNAPDIATVPGGLVIRSQAGVAIGGVGVSGATASVDEACAEAGLKAAGVLSTKTDE